MWNKSEWQDIYGETDALDEIESKCETCGKCSNRRPPRRVAGFGFCEVKMVLVADELPACDEFGR